MLWMTAQQIKLIELAKGTDKHALMAARNATRFTSLATHKRPYTVLVRDELDGLEVAARGS